MAPRTWPPLSSGSDTELEAFATYATHAFMQPGRDEHITSPGNPSPTASPVANGIFRPFGQPAKKSRLQSIDLLVAGSSLVCLGLAITAVANETVSWYLGRKNHQLIVVGFLLSIMNLCLGSIAPTFFLILEARFGPSTLQNYDAILRQQLLRSRVSIVWRLVLLTVVVLPLGLSALYKSFAGGQSVRSVDATAYHGIETYYGVFGPPGVQSIGQHLGISLFFNATLPFAAASSSDVPTTLPTAPRAYGFNILLLNNESVAALDLPQPSYVSTIQDSLAIGESWNINATVLAVVATANHSKTEHPSAYDAYFQDFCEAASESSGAYTHMSMMNDWSIELLNHASPGDQSLQYVGLTPDPGISYRPSCSAFSKYAMLYDVNRQFCRGSWSVTRGGIQLVDGSCDGSVGSPGNQLVIIGNSLFLGVWYMSSLAELLGPFATTRNGSVWLSPYVATSVAAMLWSRITSLATAVTLVNMTSSQKAAGYMANTTNSMSNISLQNLGLFYPVDDTVVYIRPTLRKSGWLYLVLTIQPLLLLLIIGTSLMFYSTPVTGGFGLVSILSGINPRTLDTLSGAGLSGELSESVKLAIRPTRDDHDGTIRYDIVLPSVTDMKNGRLTPKITYQ